MNKEDKMTESLTLGLRTFRAALVANNIDPASIEITVKDKITLQRIVYAVEQEAGPELCVKTTHKQQNNSFYISFSVVGFKLRLHGAP